MTLFMDKHRFKFSHSHSTEVSVVVLRSSCLFVCFILIIYPYRWITFFFFFNTLLRLGSLRYLFLCCDGYVFPLLFFPVYPSFLWIFFFSVFSFLFVVEKKKKRKNLSNHRLGFTSNTRFPRYKNRRGVQHVHHMLQQHPFLTSKATI